MSIYQNIKNEVTLRAINARGDKGILKIKNEVALKAIDACGDKGILKNANNDELTGDVKIRHQNAMKEANKHADKDGNVNPHVQAIFARMYGLI